MKIVNLGSGSKGNSTYVNCLDTHVLIDVGLCFSDLKNRLSQIEVDIEKIDAVLITHEHFDHIKGLAVLLKKMPNIKIFSSETILNAVASVANLPLENRNIINMPDFYFKDLTISAFAVSHDSRGCLGYSFYEAGENKFTIATDVGTMNKKLLSKIEEAQVVFLESNHNEELLKNYSGYPISLKARILSNSGHLANSDCGKALAVAVSLFGYKKIGLAHLSEKTNSKQQAESDVLAEMKKANLKIDENFYLTTLNQDIISEVFIA